MKRILPLIVLCISSVSIFAQSIDLTEQFNGKYDFTAIGNTLNEFENQNPSCTILSQSSATLTLDVGQTLVSAKLYWSGSAVGDFDVKLNGNDVSAERTFSLVYSGKPYFAAYADVTSIVEAAGNGNYTFSDMDISGGLFSYCDGGTNYGGWSIIIIYEDPALLWNQISLFDGLEAVSATQNTLNITLTNIYAKSDLLSKIGFLAWEGDQQIAVGESLFINNTLVGNPPLNPSTNAFNGTNSYTNSSTLYNMDLDFYDLTGIIYPGVTELDIKLTSQQDFIMVNNIITSVNSELPDATIAIDGVTVSPQLDEIYVTYTVSNMNSTNVLPANTSVRFYADNVQLAEDFTNQDIPIGGTITDLITIPIPVGTPSNFALVAVIDGDGMIPETNEGNNEYVFPIVLQYIVIEDPAANLVACDDDNDGFYAFDLSLQTPVITLGDPNLTVTYHTTLTDAQNAVLPVGNPYINDMIYYDSPIINSQDPGFGTGGIWSRVTSSTSNEISIVPFALEVRATPVGSTPAPLSVCDDNNDGFAFFNLSVVESEVLGGLNPVGFDLYYYEDFSQAVAAGDVAMTNPDFSQAISSPQNYVNTTNPQTIYVLLVANANGTIPPNPNSSQGCYDIVELQLIVNDTPPITQPIDLIINDGDGDDFAIFDLTVNIPVILGSLNPADYVVSFYETEANAQNNEFAIANPTVYQNLTNPQTIYVRLESINSGCFEIASFEIEADKTISVASFAFEDLSISPNPTSKSFTVQSAQLISETTISIYDIQGKQLFSEKILPQNGKVTMNVSSLENGVYFVKIASEGNTAIKKLLKN